MGRILLSLLLVTLNLSTILGKDLNWWKSSVIYQIYPRSFKDTDGNGIGDLQGIIDNIQYIKQLGIDAVWLSPVYPTENKDYGYDITDMENIDKIFGNLTIFDTLVKELHAAGIKLIMDFVPNHTSNVHSWFNHSLQGKDKYKDYYVWRPGNSDFNEKYPPNNWISGISEGSAWTYHNFRGQYYLHQFLPEQPDLNYENDEVLKEMIDVLDFWLKRGVDGFRMDAIFTICENQDFLDEQVGPHGERYHEKTFDQPKTFDILAKFRSKLDEFTAKDNVTRLMMVENYNSDPYVIKKYYGTKDVPIAHFPFNFYLIMNISVESDARDWAKCINEWYNVMEEGNHANWVLGNHDQHRVASRFSTDHIDLLNIIILSLKGTAITYNGEEFGMFDSIVRMDQAKDPQGKNVSYADFLWKSRDPERGPFLWNTSAVAGFSSNLNPWIPVSPAYWKINVETQNKTDRSHLNIYREMVALRKMPTLKYGRVNVTPVSNNTLAIFRSYDDNLSVVVVVNLGNLVETINLKSQRKSLPDKLYFFTASLNVNDFKDKDSKYKTYESSKIILTPKSALVLTTQPLK